MRAAIFAPEDGMAVVDRVDNPQAGQLRGRAAVLLDWLRGRTDTALGRLVLEWFRTYFQASRNSGCAATVYSSLSVLPAALVAVAYFHSSGSDTNLFAQRLITHLKLSGTASSLVTTTFGSASENRLAATAAVVVSFLLWGIGIGQIFQDVYARAWRVKVGSAADQARYALFFFVFSGAIALAVIAAAELHGTGWYVLAPLWLAASTAFWLWVPSFLLHRKVGLRALLPGALLAAVVLGGAVATSPLFLAAPLNANGKAFSSFGVVLTIIGYVFVMIVMSLVCAVFSPVWAAWRRTERATSARPEPELGSAG
jgi:membrane protein